MNIILASASPARKRLMQKLGIKFKCKTSTYKEDMRARVTAGALAKFLALQKAKSIAKSNPNSIIIGADTFATLKGKKLGKPKNIQEAKTLLKMHSKKTVTVHSAIAVIQTDKNGKIAKKQTIHVKTKLVFKKITDANIEDIIKKDEVLTVAGAITIEGESGKFVEKIDGDYNNIIGLSLIDLKKMLNKFNIKSKPLQ